MKSRIIQQYNRLLVAMIFIICCTLIFLSNHEYGGIVQVKQISNDDINIELLTGENGGKAIQPLYSRESPNIEPNIPSIASAARSVVPSNHVSSPVMWEPKRIDPQEFHYLILEENVCTGDPVELLIYIHSAPKNTKQRLAIRETWASPDVLVEMKARLVFFLGAIADRNLSMLVQMESQEFHDIIQENYLDAYRNLSYKAVSAAKWITKYCPQTRYILKSDDDILVNMWSIRHYINSTISPQYDRVKNCFFCLVWIGMGVIRNKLSKWYVSKGEFSLDYFPKYCSGSAYIYTSYGAHALHNASIGTPFFWVDDFFYTGTLGHKANMCYEALNSKYVLNPNEALKRIENGKAYDVWFSHVHPVMKMYTIWRTLVAQLNETDSSINKIKNTFSILDHANIIVVKSQR